MRIFIDTNTLFGYFSEDADVSPLEELLKLVKERKVTVFHTKQLENEFLRGIGNRIEKVRKAIKSSGTAVKCDLPDKLDIVLKEKIQKKIDAMDKSIVSDSKKRLKKYEAKTKKVEKTILNIFKKSKRLNYTVEILERAKLRHLKGNPPKKDNSDSYGDAINWEFILEHAIDDDLTIISRDNDFVEKSDGRSEVNRLLQKEWVENSDSELKLALGIGSLINKTEKKKVISDDTVTKEETSPAYTDDAFDILWMKAGTYARPAVDNYLSGPGVISDDMLMNNIISASIDGTPKLTYCPYCGYKNPISADDITTASIYQTVSYMSYSGRRCRACGKEIPLGV